MPNKTTIDQWRALIAFADMGTYGGAATRLHRSTSAVFESVKQLTERLDVVLIRSEGRRSELTDEGLALLRRARRITCELDQLEQLADDFKEGWEAEIGLAVELIFPSDWLRDVLRRFEPEARSTHLQLHETALSATVQLLTERQVDLAVLPDVPAGFIGRALTAIPFVAVASPQHPLHQSEAPIRLDDLATERQIVIRDPGSAPIDAGWLVGETRWTVSDMRRRIECIADGLGFAWLPEPMIEDQLAGGKLKRLRLREGAYRMVPLYLVFADRDRAGPGVLKLADIMTDICAAKGAGVCSA